MQESYHKDVDFDILQARWDILQHGANLFKLKDLRTIYHDKLRHFSNMIVEYDFVKRI